MNDMTNIDLGFTTIKQELPDFIYENLSKYSKLSNSYHHQPDELRALIAKKHDIDIKSVSLTSGADQAIMLLSSLYGKHGHIFTPTYISYSDIKRFGELTEHASLRDNNYEIDTSKIDGATLIFLANPNNPAGTTGKDKVLELVRNNPDAIVVVDEAYGDYVDDSVVGEVSNYSNLIVLRSFSKGYALAGFRIGYMVAQPAVLGELELESTWFNVAYTSVGAAVAALEHEDYFAKMRADIIESRKKLEEYLSGKSYTIVPGYINAVLIKFSSENEATSFVDHLKTKGITVNQGNGASNAGLDKSFVRISIGTNEQIEAIEEALSEYSPSLKE